MVKTGNDGLSMGWMGPSVMDSDEHHYLCNLQAEFGFVTVVLLLGHSNLFRSGSLRSIITATPLFVLSFLTKQLTSFAMLLQVTAHVDFQ